jgi:hypothetical protein
MPLRDLAVDGFGKHQDLNSTCLAGTDADIEVTGECGTAAAGAIGTKRSESLGEKWSERQVEHSSPEERQGSHNNLAGRTSGRHCQLQMDHHALQDMEAVQTPVLVLVVPVQLLEC